MLKILAASVVIIFHLPPALTARTVDKIDVITDARVPRTNLSAFLSVRPGMPLNPYEINHSIHLLKASGYCHQVVAVTARASSSTRLRFFCEVRPWIRKVRFIFETTHHFSHRRLMRFLTDYYSGFPVSPPDFDAWMKNIEQYYHRKGFPEARVRYDLRMINPDVKAMELRVIINEGPEQWINRVEWKPTIPCILIRNPIEATIRKGRRFDDHLRQFFERIIRSIRDRGYPLARLQVREIRRTMLSLEATCGPRVVISIKGWPSNVHMRFKPLTLLYGYHRIDNVTLSDLERALRQRLRDAGYPDASVTARPGKPFTPGLQRVNITIVPGQRRVLGDIRARGVPDPYLHFIERWHAGMPWLPEQFARWLQTLEERLRNDGYASARCSYQADESHPEAVRLTVECQTGEKMTIANVQFFGNLTWDDPTLQKIVQLKPGHPFRTRDVTISADQIRQWYWQHGFFKVTVEPFVSRVPGSDQVRIDFRIVEGPQTRVGYIVLNGLRRTDPGLVYRFLKFKPNAPLRLDLLERFQEDLYNLGIFSRVDIPVPLPEQMSEQEDLVIHLREANPLRVTYGLGYQERDHIRGIITVTHQNLFGRAYQAFGLFRFSLRNRRVFGSFGGPMLYHWPLEWRLAAETEFQDRVSFDMTRYLVSFQTLHHFRRRRSLSAEISFSQTRVTNIQFIDPVLIAREFENLRLTKLTFNFVDDTRDDVLDPTRGYFVTLSAEFSPKPLGSDVNFIKFSGQINGYRKILPHWVLAAAFRGGWGRRIGRSNIMPVSQRFFAGGSRSHRGVSLEKLGPRDPITGAPLGGNSFLIMNLENRFRLFGPWGAVAFLDVGNVFLQNPSLRLKDLREAAGFGLRYDAPIGLVGIDFAWLLDRRPDEKRFRWFVTIGQEF